MKFDMLREYQHFQQLYDQWAESWWWQKLLSFFWKVTENYSYRLALLNRTPNLLNKTTLLKLARATSSKSKCFITLNKDDVVDVLVALTACSARMSVGINPHTGTWGGCPSFECRHSKPGTLCSGLLLDCSYALSRWDGGLLCISFRMWLGTNRPLPSWFTSLLHWQIDSTICKALCSPKLSGIE